ncbi:hypothetical protein AXY43_16030 [Clostridium sp. MF28]|uniref:hypothetical protein n=1 Tax=Clostridium TaxID=1485 RepID=UPI000CF88F23|nr:MULTISPECIES: hypothetical protein [Clostridium]AVK49384.1 hypothetical protein AXY43_16030 [Clostridium sp. MF28]PSM57999.1 hypothetical protein C4L39_09280 [Clostridium diolis]
MLKKHTYQEQINRFQTKIKDVDDMVVKIKLFLKEVFKAKCTVPQYAYNSVVFIIEDCIYMQISLCWIQSNNNGNNVDLLKLREIEIDVKYRNNGYCTSLIKFLENIALIHGYDGIEIESVYSEEMLNIAKKLKYFKAFEGIYDYIQNYRKLFLS